MLVLTRKIGEQICVPQFGIVLTVLAVQGQRVRVGIEAPANITVVRDELLTSSPQRLTGPELSVTHASIPKGTTGTTPAKKRSSQ